MMVTFRSGRAPMPTSVRYMPSNGNLFRKVPILRLYSPTSWCSLGGASLLPVRAIRSWDTWSERAQRHQIRLMQADPQHRREQSLSDGERADSEREAG